jgi:hypothetical protein
MTLATLAGTVVTITGALDAATITVTLEGYGNAVPTTSDGTIGELSTVGTCTASGAYSIPLYANSQITPAGTYYSITVEDSNGGFISQGSFQVPAGTNSIQALTPYYPGH